MIVHQLQDPDTETYTYVLADPETRQAVIIDPVLTQHARDAAFLRSEGLSLTAVLDTHVHADHITGSDALRERFGATVVVGQDAGIDCADRRVGDGDRIVFGTQALIARPTPGHTAGCTTFVAEDQSMAFTGDALLIGGCGRTDFQGGDAATLYQSLHEHVLSLPHETVLYPGHDYHGRTHTTVGAERQTNKRLRDGIDKDAFVKIMDELNLPYPRYIDRALPANRECGRIAAEPLPIERGAGVPEITAAWFAAHSAGIRLIDVREVSEFNDALGHAPNAELVPLATLAARAIDWDRERPLAVICRSGGRSGMGARLLESMGFHSVASVRGGMSEWNRLGLDVARAH